MEHVRVTAPDLARRAAMERTRGRLVFAAACFALLFGGVAAKLADATIVQPMRPHERPLLLRLPDDSADAPAGPQAMRAMIVDRHNEILAVSLPTAELYADPREMIDTAEAAHRLKLAVPRLDEAQMRERLASSRQFVYLARRLTPQEELTINALGIPGVSFQPSAERHYPLGRVAAHVLGGADVDGHGVAGVERFFDERLRDQAAPLRLSLDVRVQAVVRDELATVMDEFHAIGACGIVMDVRTGEVLTMVSLPDYDANQFGEAPPEDRFNRAVTGMYEPGSTFKLQTAAMALDSGAAQIWNEFDASHDIKVGRFTISDFEGKHRWLFLPEVLAYSSNLGAAHIALTVGAERQRAWLDRMGMFRRVGIQLPEAGLPIVPSVASWRELVTMTVGFGHGIAVSPLHVVRGTAAVANGGIRLRPTILATQADAPPIDGVRVMQQSTSDTLRKLMRLVVTNGYGKPADVPGYFVGGKTGTAEKVGAHGYKKHSNVSAFVSIFPMNAPHYAVYMMLDEPHGNASTGGFSTAGAVAAPAAGRVIARIAPMLGVMPQTDDAAAIQASLAIPLQPARPAGAHGPASPPVAAMPPLHAEPGGAPASVSREHRQQAEQSGAPDDTASQVASR
ncbi:MAG: penicillin-binding protein 2 [Acidisphaera sp.]|nr:penicillin-binding protein 2 [Acidisphaera sp.]